MKKADKMAALSLMELIIVVIILGILLAIAIPQYTKVVERSHDKEAYTNLNLILAAQKVYRLKNNDYYGPDNSFATINTNLELELKDTNFDYEITAVTSDPDPDTFTATATRNSGSYINHYWEITQATDPSCFNGCP